MDNATAGFTLPDQQCTREIINKMIYVPGFFKKYIISIFPQSPTDCTEYQKESCFVLVGELLCKLNDVHKPSPINADILT